MFTVNAQRITTYSRCPKRAEFAWDIEKSISVSTNQYVVSQVVKAAYLFQMKKERFPSFRQLSKWADQYLQERMLCASPEEVYKQNKHTLAILNQWYKYYLEEYFHDSLVNLPVTVALNEHVAYFDTIDIVNVGSEVQLFDFLEVRDRLGYKNYNGIQIFNNMEILCRLWSFWKASEIKPTKYVRWVIGSRSIKPVIIRVPDKILEKAEGYVRHITRGIQNKQFYPSFSEQCIHCPFRQHCSM